MKIKFFATLILVLAQFFSVSTTYANDDTKAYLEITLIIKDSNRPTAVGVYQKYKQPFLTRATGATSKNLLVRAEDVQVLHGFMSVEDAKAYLKSDLFSIDVVGELGPLLEAAPEVRIYQVF